HPGQGSFPVRGDTELVRRPTVIPAGSTTERAERTEKRRYFSVNAARSVAAMTVKTPHFDRRIALDWLGGPGGCRPRPPRPDFTPACPLVPEVARLVVPPMDELNEVVPEVQEEPAPPPEPAPPIESRFLFVDVAALRAKQLRRGARLRFSGEEVPA